MPSTEDLMLSGTLLAVDLVGVIIRRNMITSDPEPRQRRRIRHVLAKGILRFAQDQNA